MAIYTRCSFRSRRATSDTPIGFGPRTRRTWSASRASITRRCARRRFSICPRRVIEHHEAAGRFSEDDRVPFEHGHGDRFQLVLPRWAVVEGFLHEVALLERRECPQPHERIRLLEVDQRTDDLHSQRSLGGHGASLKELDELGAAAFLDFVSANFYDHYLRSSFGAG